MSKHQRAVYEIAEGQQGYFTMAQAVAAGVPSARLPDMYRRGVVERISRGVYRLLDFPRAPTAQLMEATLWPSSHREDNRGVLSHESALAFHRISDVSSSRVHITVPRSFRIRRAVPRYMRIHHADLSSGDIVWREGIPVTTAVRAIRDCHAEHLGPALVRQAIEDGRRLGELTTREAATLTAELLDAPSDASAATMSR
jgi:predicted transcriptional regulator of viral defense system